MCDFLFFIQITPTAWTYISPESVVLLSESLPAVRRPEGSTHQVLDHHSYVNQCVVVGRHHMLKQTSSHSFLFSLICSTAMIHIFIRYKVTKICFVCQYFIFWKSWTILSHLFTYQSSLPFLHPWLDIAVCLQDLVSKITKVKVKILKQTSKIGFSCQWHHTYRPIRATYSVVEFLQPRNGQECVHTDSIFQQQLDKVYPVINECIHHGLFQGTFL